MMRPALADYCAPRRTNYHQSYNGQVEQCVVSIKVRQDAKNHAQHTHNLNQINLAQLGSYGSNFGSSARRLMRVELLCV